MATSGSIVFPKGLLEQNSHHRYEPEMIVSYFGGLSPNCSDYCNDYWNYNVTSRRWHRLYGEWWGVFQVSTFPKLY